MATSLSDLSSRENIPVRVFTNPAQVSRTVADEIDALLRKKAAAGQRCVLGLATGSTPTAVYAELIRRHRDEGLSFANVTTFNLDEYWPMQPQELQSYVRFMNEHLFDHIDIDRANIHVPDGTLEADDVRAFCAAYEQAIAEAGGIDIQLLGIGRTGHIGFNEPGSARASRTRSIWLDRLTCLDAASDFFGIEHVPQRGITMGVATILSGRRLVMMALGEGKAPILAKAVEGEVNSAISASHLQEHVDAVVYADGAASAGLTRSVSPWLLGTVEWTPELIRKAVIWLAQTAKKPILEGDRRALQRPRPTGADRRPRTGLRHQRHGVSRDGALG